MLRKLIEAARSNEVKNIRGIYVPTLKNKVVSGLYLQLGFGKLSETDSEQSFMLDIETYKLTEDDFISVSQAESSGPMNR